jgi:hypothetical protein
LIVLLRAAWGDSSRGIVANVFNVIVGVPVHVGAVRIIKLIVQVIAQRSIVFDDVEGAKALRFFDGVGMQRCGFINKIRNENSNPTLKIKNRKPAVELPPTLLTWMCM